jgi:hypothetical protein
LRILYRQFPKSILVRHDLLRRQQHGDFFVAFMKLLQARMNGG